MEFLIRMKDGLFFDHMFGFAVVATSDESKAFHFRSRMAALQIMSMTHEFEGSAIIEAQPQAVPVAG